MKTLILTSLLIGASSFASVNLECNLVDYSNNSTVVASAKATADQFGQILNLPIGQVDSLQVAVPFMQILSDGSAKLTLTLGQAQSSASVLVGKTTSLKYGFYSLDCVVRQ